MRPFSSPDVTFCFSLLSIDLGRLIEKKKKKKKKHQLTNYSMWGCLLLSIEDKWACRNGSGLVFPWYSKYLWTWWKLQRLHVDIMPRSSLEFLNRSINLYLCSWTLRPTLFVSCKCHVTKYSGATGNWPRLMKSQCTLFKSWSDILMLLKKVLSLELNLFDQKHGEIVNIGKLLYITIKKKYLSILLFLLM